jgi:hypothetical protein
MNVTKILVGMIAENKLKGSRGIAPDLLLLTEDGTIIPVEIKCLHSEFREDHDFRRGIKLARGQLKSSLNILGGNQGLIVIMNIFHERGKYIYDGRMSFVKI